MKAKLFLAAVIVLVSTAAFSNGPGPRVAVVSQKNPATFKVIYAGTEAGKVRMTIFNQQDEVVFTETSKNADGFMRNVNFEGMTPGEYTIEIASKEGKQAQKIVYARNTAVKNVQVSKIANESKYVLSVASTGANEKISVRIFDGANNLVHTESRTISGNFGLVYNLSNVSGVPTFEVADNTGVVRTIRY
jgi:hypothetical protein